MLRSSLIALLLLFSAAASAEDFDYTYLWLGYGSLEIDDADIDGDGFMLGGSYAIADKIHVFAGYDSAEVDFNVDVSRLSAGVGYNTTMSDTLDLFARLSYESIEIDFPGLGSGDDSGFGFSVGGRFDVGDSFEITAAVNYVDYDDLGDDTGFEVSGLYAINDLFTVGIGADWSDDISTYYVQGRFYFDSK
jgi:long-subunit fatty acid transport protein